MLIIVFRKEEDKRWGMICLMRGKEKKTKKEDKLRPNNCTNTDRIWVPAVLEKHFSFQHHREHWLTTEGYTNPYSESNYSLEINPPGSDFESVCSHACVKYTHFWCLFLLFPIILCRKGPEVLARQQAQRPPAVCLSSQGKLHFGVHQTQHRQLVKGSDSPPIFSIGVTSPWILCIVLSFTL